MASSPGSFHQPLAGGNGRPRPAAPRQWSRSRPGRPAASSQSGIDRCWQAIRSCRTRCSRASWSRISAGLAPDESERIDPTARPKHDPRRVPVERHLPERRRHPRGAVQLLGDGRQPHREQPAARHLVGGLAPALRLPEGRAREPSGAPGRFNRARRIDTPIVNPLDKLPLGSIGAKKKPADKLELNLAFRNLVRARVVNLATGQDMVRRLKDKGIAVKPLTQKQIVDGSGGAELSSLTAPQRNAVAEKTPLSFYILREAELNGGKLDGVGARIVAETFHRAIAGSKRRSFATRTSCRTSRRTTRPSTCPTCSSSPSTARSSCSTQSSEAHGPFNAG
jgi:hypothetical protein